MDDDGLAAMFREFTQSKVGSMHNFSEFNSLSCQIDDGKYVIFQKSVLFEHGIRRLTFLVAQKVRDFFTFST